MIVIMRSFDHWYIGIGVGIRIDFLRDRRLNNAFTLTKVFLNVFVAGLTVVVVVTVLDARLFRTIFTTVYAYFAG